MTDIDACEVVITGPAGPLMPQLAHELVAARFAASAHVWSPPVDSTYWWKGELQTAKETRVHLVTRLAFVDRITAFVRERHPYEVPHVTATLITAGDREFLAWISAETLTPSSAS